MALTITNNEQKLSSSFLQTRVWNITCDATYATAGYALTPAQLGLGLVEFATCNVITMSAVGAAASCTAYYNPVTNKLKLNGPAGEIANGTDVSAIVVQVAAFGSL